MEAQLDPIFESAIDSKRVPGVAAVAMDVSGKVLFSKGYGTTNTGDADSSKMTPQTTAMIFSCTKLLTCVAALQLVEQGKLNLQDPAERYVPDIAKIQRLHGFHSDGSPDLRPPEKKILVIHLFTHTAGFTYDFFDPQTLQYRMAKNQPPAAYSSRSSWEEYYSPLIFEPGSAYTYGINNDWLGFIVQAISGLSIDKYIAKHITQPLGLHNTGINLSDAQEKNFLTVHAKDAAGKLTPTQARLAIDPETIGGGHHMYSSCEDYANFLVAIANGGTHPVSKVQLLKPETVKDYVFTDMIPQVGCTNANIGIIGTTLAPVSCEGEMLPGVRKGWSLGAMYAHEAAPNGRSAGSASWAGLGNLYYWMDPVAGKVGFVMSAILPFFDKDVLHLVDALERAVYGKPMAKTVGEAGSNFSGGEYKTDT